MEDLNEIFQIQDFFGTNYNNEPHFANLYYNAILHE